MEFGREKNNTFLTSVAFKHRVGLQTLVRTRRQMMPRTNPADWRSTSLYELFFSPECLFIAVALTWQQGTTANITSRNMALKRCIVVGMTASHLIPQMCCLSLLFPLLPRVLLLARLLQIGIGCCGSIFLCCSAGCATRPTSSPAGAPG